MPGNCVNRKNAALLGLVGGPNGVVSEGTSALSPIGRSLPIRRWGLRGGSALKESPEDRVASFYGRSIKDPGFWSLTINEPAGIAPL